MSRINLSGLQKYAIMFVLLVLMALFSLASPYFLTLRNLTNIITRIPTLSSWRWACHL